MLRREIVPAGRHFLSEGGQLRTVSPVDVEAVGTPKLLENKLPVLQPESALPGKLSGPYTELSAGFEIVPRGATADSSLTPPLIWTCDHILNIRRFF